MPKPNKLPEMSRISDGDLSDLADIILEVLPSAIDWITSLRNTDTVQLQIPNNIVCAESFGEETMSLEMSIPHRNTANVPNALAYVEQIVAQTAEKVVQARIDTLQETFLVVLMIGVVSLPESISQACSSHLKAIGECTLAENLVVLRSGINRGRQRRFSVLQEQSPDAHLPEKLRFWDTIWSKAIQGLLKAFKERLEAAQK